MLKIVTFKWRADGYRTKYAAEHVNVLRNMVQRHYSDPFEFICVTDDAAGIDPRIRIIPLWDDFSAMRSPHGPNYPSCYRRLKIFSPEAADLIGNRFVCLDLDCVIVDDVKPVWNRPEEIVLWGKTNPTTFYNCSMMLMTAGARRQVWDDFDPVHSPLRSKETKQWGSDQGWIGYKLGPNEAMWNIGHGVYSYRNHIKSNKGRLPANAKIVHFHGKESPWDDGPRALSWVAENYK